MKLWSCSQFNVPGLVAVGQQIPHHGYIWSKGSQGKCWLGTYALWEGIKSVLLLICFFFFWLPKRELVWKWREIIRFKMKFPQEFLCEEVWNTRNQVPGASRTAESLDVWDREVKRIDLHGCCCEWLLGFWTENMWVFCLNYKCCRHLYIDLMHLSNISYVGLKWDGSWFLHKIEA